MAEYTAVVMWQRHGELFSGGRYSRAHEWQFDGGAVVRASASPLHVPLPGSDPAGVDPEEAFVASLSSCHMLWFLAVAAKRGFTVDSYRDDAVGYMEKDLEGRLWIARVTLRPAIAFSGERLPGREEIENMHHAAHEECYIANSVRTIVTVDGN